MRRVVTAYGETISPEKVRAWLEQPGPHAVILPSATWQKIRASSDDAWTPGWKIYENRGWNTGRGLDLKKGQLALIDLTLVVKK